jgi:hypothetical protein
MIVSAYWERDAHSRPTFRPSRNLCYDAFSVETWFRVAHQRRKVWLIVLLAIAIAGVAAIATRRDAVASRSEAAQSAEHEAPVSNDRAPRPAEASLGQAERAAQAEPAKLVRARERAACDALRARIVSGERKVPAESPPKWHGAAAARSNEGDDPDRPGELVDRAGGRSSLVAHMNREFMPLARDCIRQAQERSPQLRGMLTLQLETVSDEKLGAVIDRAEVPTSSEVQERELAECMRENALTVIFPKSIATGHEQFELTLHLEPPASGEREQSR